MAKKRRAARILGTVTDMFDLPAELLSGLPRISMAGREDIFIENHQGIIECTQQRIRFMTKAGIIKIEGDGLILKHVGAERIAVHGSIGSVEFMA